MAVAEELEILIRAKYPIINLVSWEERRVEEALRRVAKTLNRNLHTWTVTRGIDPPLIRPGTPQAPRASALPGELEALAQIYEAPEYTIFLLKDFHPYMKDFRVIRLLRDLAARLRGRAQTVVLLGPSLTLPTDLEKDITVLDFGLPDAKEIRATLEKVLVAIQNTPGLSAELTPEQKELLVLSAQGLTLDEIESVFARSLVEHKRLDVDVVLQEKQQLIRKSGLLEYFPAEAQLGDVGGMDLLKVWLTERTDSFSERARAFGLPSPKGVLLLGVQGCGKSLLAKAVSAHWNLPMLRLDVGRIFGSLVGQSEDNIRRAIAVSESVAPCVLWADELEKGFGGVGSSGASDGGTTARVFATFLTWMQEKTAPVFLIATANNVSALPPEMLRKGRFDEIFFVDLPSRREREHIWTIHIGKRNRNPATFDVAELAERSHGFSGAEIEQAVVGGLYLAFSKSRDLVQEDLIAQINQTVPLSVMMREEIDALREWAAPRTRPASVSDT
jgi:ATP-dependent 26S proteasome regulatory subunit